MARHEPEPAQGRHDFGPTDDLLHRIDLMLGDAEPDPTPEEAHHHDLLAMVRAAQGASA